MGKKEEPERSVSERRRVEPNRQTTFGAVLSENALSGKALKGCNC